MEEVDTYRRMMEKCKGKGKAEVRKRIVSCLSSSDEEKGATIEQEKIYMFTEEAAHRTSDGQASPYDRRRLSAKKRAQQSSDRKSRLSTKRSRKSEKSSISRKSRSKENPNRDLGCREEPDYNNSSHKKRVQFANLPGNSTVSSLLTQPISQVSQLDYTYRVSTGASPPRHQSSHQSHNVSRQSGDRRSNSQ